MSLFIPPPPSQGDDSIKWTTLFLESDTQAGLQAQIDLVPIYNSVQVSNPRSFKWLADLQYQASGVNPNFKYSVMMIHGEYNP